MKKNIFFILTVALWMVSCSDDKEDNWTADVLNVSCDELISAGDGNFKVVLSTEYAKAINLKLQTNSGWDISVDNMTAEEVEWITPSTATGSGNADVQLLVTGNETNVDRKCSVVITTKGNIPVRKTITVIQGNTDDMLTLNIDEMSLPEGVKVNEANGGSWNVVLSKGFEGDLPGFIVEGTASYDMRIIYSEGGDGWVTEKPDGLNSLASAKALTLSVAKNTENVYREALVVFTAIAGDITVTKSFLISQIGTEEIKWNGEYFQGSLDELKKAEIILPATILEHVEIAEIKNISDSDVELPASSENDWCTLNIEDGKLFISTTKENTSTNKENVRNIVIKSKKSTQEFSINVRQCMKDYGVVLSKSYWNISWDGARINGEGTKDIKTLYDNTWSEAGKDRYVAFTKEKTDCIITIDLGQYSKEYNSIGLMPRLEWTQPVPSKITVEVSSDKEDWQLVGNRDQSYYQEQDLYVAVPITPNTKNWMHFEGIIKWISLSELKTDRYIRLSMSYSDCLWNAGNGPFCFDEFFVSKK